MVASRRSFSVYRSQRTVRPKLSVSKRCQLHQAWPLRNLSGWFHGLYVAATLLRRHTYLFYTSQLSFRWINRFSGSTNEIVPQGFLYFTRRCLRNWHISNLLQNLAIMWNKNTRWSLWTVDQRFYHVWHRLVTVVLTARYYHQLHQRWQML